VKSFNPQKGWGFITCSSVHEDVYFKSPNFPFEQGTAVAFYLMITPDGKPQAQGLTTPMEDGQTVVGTVRSFSEKNGYGFIAVPDQPADVYFKKELIPEGTPSTTVVGKTVRFVVGCTPDGKPQAQTAQFLDRPPPGYVVPQLEKGVKREAPASPEVTLWGQPQKRQRMTTPMPAAALPPMPMPMPAPMPAAAGNKAKGVVKSYNPAKGYGFVQNQQQAGMGDFFFSKTSLPPNCQLRADLQGKKCSFDMSMSDQGKLQAHNIQIFG